MLASESDFATPQLELYAKNDDVLIARWHRPVASRVALDLPYWMMRSAPYRLIRMAIEMVHKAAAWFPVVDFLSCILSL